MGGKVSSQTKTAGSYVLVGKLLPKLIKVFGKLIKIFPKLLKGSASIKAAGVAGSLGLYTFLFSWQMAVSLVAFIIVHEYGHLRAMKKCGLKTKGIYLIPGFGAVAVSKERWKSARDEAYIAIMGPVFSLLFIVPVIIVYFVTGNPMYAAIASIMSLINLFNLFPLNPLDGGRVMKSLLYSFGSTIGFSFALLCVLLAFVFGVYMNLFVLLLISWLGLEEIICDYGLEEKLKDLRASFYRGLGGFLIVMCSISYLQVESILGRILLGILVVAISIIFILDSIKSTQGYTFKILVYPFVCIKKVFIGLYSIFTLKREDLTKIEEYSPMNKKEVLFYGLVFLGTIILMIWLILYTSSIPGCEFAKDILT